MSSTASFYVVPADALPDVTDGLKLATHGRVVRDAFHWSGYAMMGILEYLEDAGLVIDPPDDYDDTYAVMFTSDHADLLDPDGFDLDDVARSIRDSVNDPDFDEAEIAAEDGLTAISETVAALADDEVLIITVG